MNKIQAIEKLMLDEFEMVTEGREIWNEIVKQVNESGLQESADIEMRFYKDGKKIIVYFQVAIEECYDGETDNEYIDIHLLSSQSYFNKKINVST